MRRAWCAAALASLLVSACGSTVQLHGSTTLGGDAGLGSPVGSGADGAGVPTAGPGSAAGSLGGTGVSGGGTGGGAAGGATSGSGQPITPATRPAAGAVLKPIQVGILLYPDLNDFANTFGATADAGNQGLEVDTAVKWINAHGGAAGHKVEVIKHNVSLTSADTYDQLAQQACQDFTVDHHVVAVLAPGTSVSDNFAACLQKKGVLYLVSGHWVHDAQDWRQYSNMWSSGEADGRGIGQAMVDQLLQRRYAVKGDSVGLMVMEEPGAVRTADSIIKPQLAAAGIKVTEYTVPPPASTSDISNSVAVDDSAELKMASQNIKTVLFLCPGCLSFFAQNADSQKYYPRYIGSSIDVPSGISGSGNSNTMKSAVMIGYQPDYDVGLHSHPKELTGNPGRALCKAIMAPSGQAKGDLSELATQEICDAFLDVKYAAELNPANPLTGPALQQGMGLFGSRFACPLNYGTLLRPDHHGGETSYRMMHWDAGSTTFVYDNATRLALRF